MPPTLIKHTYNPKLPMSEFEDIQRLIRLKRFEAPKEDFVEDFIAKFHERQRSEMLRQSSLSLVWERVTTYFDHLAAPKWVLAPAVACVGLLAIWGAMNLGSHGDQNSAVNLVSTHPMPAVMPQQPPFLVDSQLIREVENDRALEIEGILLSRHFETDSTLQPEILDVVSVSGSVSPVSAELQPVATFNR
jgi:hypothetical protein